jgi:Mg2+ and Co2+ transporter CorA
MNFDRIPGAGFRQGFWIALILLLALSVGAALLIGRYLGKGAHSRTRRNRR